MCDMVRSLSETEIGLLRSHPAQRGHAPRSGLRQLVERIGANAPGIIVRHPKGYVCPVVTRAGDNCIVYNTAHRANRERNDGTYLRVRHLTDGTVAIWRERERERVHVPGSKGDDHAAVASGRISIPQGESIMRRR